jgi:DNA polymerase V
MPSGGKRRGAGRPKGKGPWGEATRPMRIPESMVKGVADFLAARGYRLPLYASRVPAGSPSPAGNDIANMPELSKLLLSNPRETFLLRVTGDSMIDAGIDDGDLLFVDRSIEPRSKKIVVASINGQTTVKRFYKTKDKVSLLPENSRYKPIEINRNDELIIHGVATKSLKNLT